MVSGRSFGSSAVSLACITSMCSVQCFRGGNSLRLAFGSFFYFITCAYWGGMLKGSIRRQRHYFVSPKISLTFSRHPLLSSKPLAGVQ